MHKGQIVYNAINFPDIYSNGKLILFTNLPKIENESPWKGLTKHNSPYAPQEEEMIINNDKTKWHICNNIHSNKEKMHSAKNTYHLAEMCFIVC